MANPMFPGRPPQAGPMEDPRRGQHAALLRSAVSKLQQFRGGIPGVTGAGAPQPSRLTAALQARGPGGLGGTPVPGPAGGPGPMSAIAPTAMPAPQGMPMMAPRPPEAGPEPSRFAAPTATPAPAPALTPASPWAGGGRSAGEESYLSPTSMSDFMLWLQLLGGLEAGGGGLGAGAGGAGLGGGALGSSAGVGGSGDTAFA